MAHFPASLIYLVLILRINLLTNSSRRHVKKLRRLALKSALSAKVADKEIIVLDELKFDAPKTKEMIKVLANVKAGKKALIVMAEKDENVVKSAANIPGVRTALVGTMNVYEIVNHDSFIVTQEAVKKIEEVYI